MSIPVKTLKSGLSLPVLGFGTWQIGGRHERDPANDDETDIRAIRQAIDRGITHIDTAEKYANGYTETLIGQAIHGYDRSKLFLASKVQSIHLGYDDLLRSCEQSLERLQTDYLDLYLFHSYNPQIPFQDSLRALDRLIAEGLVKRIGVANFTKEQLAEAQTYTGNKLVCNQVHYNLVAREPETSGLLTYCQQNDIFLIAWRPLGKGTLIEQVPSVIRELCEKYQKTPAQIAINWLVSRSNVLTIFKTSDLEHLEENLGAVGWEMASEDIERIRREYPDQKAISDVVPLGAAL